MGSGRLTLRRRLMQSSCKTWVLSTPLPEFHRSSISARARLCLTPAEVSCAYIKILVSTKNLSIMQFVPRSRRCPTQIEPFSQASLSTFASHLITFALPHHLLQLGCEQGADGRALFGSQDASFSYQIRFYL